MLIIARVGLRRGPLNSVPAGPEGKKKLSRSNLGNYNQAKLDKLVPNAYKFCCKNTFDMMHLDKSMYFVAFSRSID